ncbi:YihY/virulence factor BrkB family protein [Falsihalocynthiibacter sp. SS001]|uniref:YihY/virulence factor BrkB family protein n=1 Tax=Falsihalocynthiibacter sp. SS001 TaxID=3349698 RepID=UPI0036D3465D
MDIKRVARALFIALRRFHKQDGLALSSHVALSLMLAIFPFTIFALSLGSQLSSTVESENIMQLLFGNWPDVVAEPIERELRAVLAQGNSQTLTFGALMTMFFASNGAEAVRLAITRAYGEVDTRPYWRKRLLCIGFVLAGAVSITVVTVLLVLIPLYFAYFQDMVPIPEEWLSIFNSTPLRFAIAVVPIVAAVLAVNSLLTQTRRPISVIWPGAVLTIFAWAIFGQAFSYYLGHFARYSVTYAGLAGVMSGLIFLYLSAAILIIGATFNSALMDLKQEAKIA